MQMTDSQDSRNEPRKSDYVKFAGLKFQGKVDYIDEMLNKLDKMLDQQIKERGSKDRDSRDSRDRRDSRDSRNNRDSRSSRDSRRSHRSDSDSSSEDDRYRSRSRDSSRSRSCTIPVPVIVLCLSAIFVRNINSSELHFQSVALGSQYSGHAPEAVTLH